MALSLDAMGGGLSYAMSLVGTVSMVGETDLVESSEWVDRVSRWVKSSGCDWSTALGHIVVVRVASLWRFLD